MNTLQWAGCATAVRTVASRLLLAAILVLSGCSSLTPEPPTISAPAPADANAPSADGLTAEEAATLGSLTKVDDYPLYAMRYYGPFHAAKASEISEAFNVSAGTGWACALFAALGDADNRLYGRNFDWRFSPALLLFTEPPDGYASVSMVDLEYFGFSDRATGRLVDPTQLSLAERRSLLMTPTMPFDGLNAAGVAVGMAAVPQADGRHDRGKPAIGEIAVIREILDHAARVDEAVAILQQYNIDWEGGPPLHYLVADRSGRAALVEFHAGQIVVLPETGPWHAATNFTRSAVSGDAAGECPRYDTLVRRLTAANGALASKDALGLLRSVAQSETATQWSVVYNMSKGQVDVVMGRHYDRVHTFQLDAPAP
jgi:hypothetical protein